MCSAAVLLLVKFGRQAALASRQPAIATMATVEEYEVVGMGGSCCRGASASCVRVAPKPSGPAGPALQERVSGIVSVVVRVTWQWAEIVLGLVQVL